MKNITEKTDDSQLEICEFIERFIDYQKGIGRTGQTLSHHRCSLRIWRQFLDKQNISKLTIVTPMVAAEYQTWLYQLRSRYGRPYSLQSQIVILNSLQVFFKYLVKAGHILSNPAEVIQLPREPKKLPGKILSSREMKKLLLQPDTGTVLGFRDRTIYEVLYSTGLRVSELTGMRVQDLVLSQPSTIFVAESKNFKDRIVPVGKSACRYLSEYLKNIRPLRLRSSAPSAVKALFLNRLGKTMDKSGVEKKLQIYGQRAGIKKHLTVHVFRHTLATEMLKAGADLRQIQELLGHKSLRTTQLYTHVVKGELKRIQQKCHPREQVELPVGFVKYRGRKYLHDNEKTKEKRN